MAQRAERIKGATEVQLQSPPGLPQLTIRPRKADLERWGLDTVEVLNVVRTAYQGDIVGQTLRGQPRLQRHRDPRQGKPRERRQRRPTCRCARAAGNFVLLKQIADMYPDGRALSGRLHLGGQRVQAVTANVIGRDVGSFVAEAARRRSNQS